MENCYSSTLTNIKATKLYKDLPRTLGKSKLKKKELCDAINNHYEVKEEIEQTPVIVSKTPRRFSEKKEKILQQIMELKEIYKAKGDTYRERAYDNAFYALKQIDVLPKTKKELIKVKGIGKSTADKIFEAIKTGQIKKLKELRESQKEIEELISIDGIGPKFAEKLLKKGINNLQKLRKEYKKGNIKLTNVQQLGINYYEDLHEKLPRREIKQFEKEMKKIVKSIDKNLDFEIMGSYRRGKKKSGDIDLLLYHSNIKIKEQIKRDFVLEIVQKLSEEYKYIGKLAQGKKKFMGLFILKKLVRHIDILFVPMENLYAAINYFTGSKEHNIRLREYAKKKGYTINEFNLKKGKKIIPLKSERDLFDKLGLPFIKPTDR